MQGRLLDAERHFRDATKIGPKMELASLCLFHALGALDRHVEAFEEMVRFLSLRESLGYRELMSDSGLENDLPEEQRRLARIARSLLSRHRQAQRARSEVMQGDTVRVRSHAPGAARPGSLACVRGQRTAVGDEADLEPAGIATTLFRVAFSDGESVEVTGDLLDRADI